MTKRSHEAVRVVRAAGGVVRSEQLVREGFSVQDVADAVRSGALVRERRFWVAAPDADAELRVAARHGVVLSCVTQAQRLGLWVLDASVGHVACHPHAGDVRVPGAVLHRHAPLMPRAPGVLVDSLVNVLQIVAICQPYDVALAV